MAARLTGLLPRPDLLALAVGSAFYGVFIAVVSYWRGPAAAVGISLGTAVVILAFTRPLWALCVGIAAIPLETIQFSIGPFGLSPGEAILALSGLGFAVHRLVLGQAPWTPTPLGKPFALLILAIVPGLAVATNQLTALKTLGFWILFFFVFQMIVIEGNRDVVRLLLGVLALAGAIVGLHAVVDSAGTPQQLVGFGDIATGRAAGAFGHPNTLASFEALALPAALALALGGPVAFRGVAAGAFVAIFTAIVLSLSRGGLLAVAGALGVMLIWRPFRRAAMIGTAVVAVFAVLGAAQFGEVQQADIVTKRLSSLSYTASGVDPRFEVWGAVPDMIRSNLLIGVGQNQFPNAAPNYGLVNLNSSGTFEHAHNVFLTTFAELGVVGFVAYAWLGIALALVLLRTIRSKTADRGLAVAVAAGLVAFVLQGMVDYTLRSEIVVAGLVILAGCAVVLQRDAVSAERARGSGPASRRPSRRDGSAPPRAGGRSRAAPRPGPAT